MLQVSLKIELNNLDKAKTELNALLVTVAELEKVYGNSETADVNEVAKETPAPKKRATRKKATPKTEDAPKPVVEEEKASEPVEEEKATEDAPTTDLTLGDLTALAKKAVAKAGRDTVKDLIASFGKGKLSSVDADKYEALATELNGLAV